MIKDIYEFDVFFKNYEIIIEILPFSRILKEQRISYIQKFCLKIGIYAFYSIWVRNHIFFPGLISPHLLEANFDYYLFLVINPYIEPRSLGV